MKISTFDTYFYRFGNYLSYLLYLYISNAYEMRVTELENTEKSARG